MKSVILYYSYGGNTRRIAKTISRAIGADLAEIQPMQPYIGSYDQVVEQGQDEVDRGYMPAIQPMDVDLTAYDTVILGTPVWWYTFAPAMKTFLHQADLQGKHVYAFATNGGWIGHTFEDFAAACPGAHVHHGLNVRFEQDQQLTPDQEILTWAKAIR